MITAQCGICEAVTEMSTEEDEEGVITASCPVCGDKQTILFDTLPPTSYSGGTPSEGAAK